MRKVVGWALVILGIPALPGLLVCMLCAGGGPQNLRDSLLLLACIPLMPLAILFGPILALGLEVLDDGAHVDRE